MSFRNASGIVKPVFNPFAAQTSNTWYYLYVWGNNQGELGLGNNTSYSSPVQVGSSTEWTTISEGSAGAGHSVVIKENGTMWSWGYNHQGQLGLGNRTSYSSPKQVGALTTWAKVAAGSGSYNCLAIRTDGTLWSWGSNAYHGQLGLGNNTSYSSPVQVGALTNWSKIWSAGYNCAAIKTDGTLWMWGNGQGGSLGLGNTTKYSSPKQVGALTTWVEMGIGNQSTFGISASGTMWSWGRNPDGRLGQNNTTYYSSPKQVGALTNWSKVDVGYYHGIAVKTDGTLWSWGSNSNGQLGLGNRTAYSSPKQVGVLTDWLKISAAYIFSSAIKTDGTLWTWGQNSAGQLGLGNTTQYSSPKQVGSLTTWARISAGDQHMLASE